MVSSEVADAQQRLELCFHNGVQLSLSGLLLIDRSTEYCWQVDRHDYQLYLAINDIYHTKTNVMSPQTNGLYERFHWTILNEFYQITFREKLYLTMEELQKDLDDWMDSYNNHRTHQGKVCCGRTSLVTLLDGKRFGQKGF